MVTNTISIPELLWTIGTSIGLFFNLRQLTRAVVDFREVRRRRINSIREYAASTTLYMFGSWTFIQVVFVLVGIAAMTIPSPQSLVSSVQYAILIGFVGISFFLAISGYIVDNRRAVLINMIAQMEEGFDGES